MSPVIHQETFNAIYEAGISNAEVSLPNYGVLRESWSGYSIQRLGTVAPFVVPGVDANSHTNIAGAAGSFRGWVMPYWSSSPTGEGNGPGAVARLLEFAAEVKGQSVSLWRLAVNEDGSAISLIAAGDSGDVVLIKVEINWKAGEWHQIVLNYGSALSDGTKGMELVLDGAKAGESSGVIVVPPKVARLVVGSSLTGEESFSGEIDELFCFSKPLKMAFHYLAFKEQAALGPVTEAEVQARAERHAELKARREARRSLEGESGDGGMMLRMSGPSASCVTNGPVYLTNVLVTLTTNDGWTVYFDIAGGTNEVVYDIFSTPELAGNDVTNSVWTWLETGMTCETHYYTNQPTNQTFYILTVPGADRDGDGIYDGWECKHFGTLAQSASGDYDGNGETNGLAYANHTDPNQIKFALDFGSRRVSSNSASGEVLVLQGTPDWMAVLVNSSNFPAAQWQPHDSNVTVNLGTTDGIYSVWIGLRGHSPDGSQLWRGAMITRDTVSPTVVVTNPATTTISQSLIQLQGYSPEPLSSVSFGISNAAIILTNQQGYVTGQHLDTNTLSITTNWFQCYDLQLTNGLNAITLRVTDVAGNVTTTNFNVTFDTTGDTNAPVIAVTWPTENLLVSGVSFTLEGSVSEAASEVVVALGSESTVAVVERNGRFQVENVPLASATNIVTVTAKDAAGNTSTNQVTVHKSTTALTINSPPATELLMPTATVSGTVGNASQSVWVNNVQASVDGGGAWIATNVPVNSGGVAVFEVQAGATFGAPVAAQRMSLEKPPVVKAVSYHDDYFALGEDVGICPRPLYWSRLVRVWHDGAGGSSSNRWVDTWELASVPICTTVVPWTATWPGGAVLSGQKDCPSSSYTESTPSAWQYAEWASGFTEPYYGEGECLGLTILGGQNRRSTRTEIALEANAKQDGSMRLVRLTASAAAHAGLLDYGPFYSGFTFPIPEGTGTEALPLAAMKINGQRLTATATNADVGETFITLSGGTTQPLTVTITGADDASFDVKAEEVSLKIFVGSNTNDMAGKTNTVIVGQRIELRCEPAFTNAPITAYQWTIPGYAISNYVTDANSSTVYSNFPTANSNVFYYWVDGGSNRQVECSVTVGGQTVVAKTTFDVIRPLPTFYAEVRDQVRVDTFWYFSNNRQLLHPGTNLHFGISSSLTNEGIAFYYSNAPVNSITSETFGRYALAQIVEYVQQRYNIGSGTNCVGYQFQDSTGLDSSFPSLGTESETVDYIGDRWADSPGTPLTSASWLAHTNSFITYLMFRPRPYDSSTIDVPMYRVKWAWSGSATNYPWGKVSGSQTCSQPSIATNFPYWTHPIIELDTSPIPSAQTNCFNEN